MKNTMNYPNQIISRIGREVPLEWAQLDENMYYGNIWKTEYNYKTGMVVLYNDRSVEEQTGRMSFFMCIEEHFSSPGNKPKKQFIFLGSY